MPGHWVDPPEEHVDAEEANAAQVIEEEEEDMLEEDASTGSDTERM